MIKNKKKIPLFISVCTIAILVIILLYCENKVDPDWIETKDISKKNILTLENSSDSLNFLLSNFTKEGYNDSNYAYNFIADPFVPTMEFSKFKYYFNLVSSKKFIVISSVTGTGLSTLIDRIANLIALNKDRILKIKCAPQFDLQYNKRYIGTYQNSRFEKGELLKFWDSCLANPNNNFIAIIDNLDKINPETFFGPEIWEELGNNDESLFMEENKIKIPDNFYMISTSLSGVGSRIQLNNEHFKRLGRQYFLEPSTIELALYLNDIRDELQTKVNKLGIFTLTNNELKKYKALTDKTNYHNFLYFFEKSNDLLTNQLSRGYQLGQWNKLRNLYLPEQFDEFLLTFINHINATLPESKFSNRNFDPIFYSINNDGKLKGTNIFASSFRIFAEWGFFTEFVVAASFAIITALLSAYYVRKRKTLVNKYLSESENIYNSFVSSHLNSGDALNELIKLKAEIDKDAKNGKLNYSEAIFFYNSIRDRSEGIEITKNINQSFLQLIDTFLEDNILSESEHTKLISFLDKIKTKIPNDDYNRLRNEVTRVWNEHGINNIRKN